MIDEEDVAIGLGQKQIEEEKKIIKEEPVQDNKLLESDKVISVTQLK